MADFFKAWVMSMSAIIIFGSMCEMILPDNSYKKYVHLAIGLMLIMSVLKPIVNREIDIKAEIPTGDYKTEKTAEKNSKEDIARIYKSKIKERLALETGLEKAEFDIEICEEDEFGKIEKICIKTSKRIEGEKIDTIMGTYGLTEDEIEVEYTGRGDGYGT